MKEILFNIFFLVFFTHHYEQRPLIEIYFLKQRLTHTDTLNYSGRASRPFKATQDDLLASPFIFDNEILGYDTTNSKSVITFSSTAASKIAKLEPDILEGIQFVLSVNRNPILNGYFTNKFTSQAAFTYYIVNFQDSIHAIGNGSVVKDSIDSRRDQHLLNAFSKTNRLF